MGKKSDTEINPKSCITNGFPLMDCAECRYAGLGVCKKGQIVLKVKRAMESTDVAKKLMMRKNWRKAKDFLKSSWSKVFYVLRFDEKARDDDIYLYQMIIRHFTPYKDISREDVMFVMDVTKHINYNTVKGERAKIQNEWGLFPPTDEIAIKRYHSSSHMDGDDMATRIRVEGKLQKKKLREEYEHLSRKRQLKQLLEETENE